MTSADSFTTADPQTLSELLVRFILTRRWYRDKTRVIREAEIADVIQIPGTSSCFVTLNLQFTEGDWQTYLIAMAAQAADADSPVDGIAKDSIIAELHEGADDQGILYDAFFNPQFCQLLLRSLQEEAVFSGATAEIKGQRTSAFDRMLGDQQIDSLTSQALQSRTEQHLHHFWRSLHLENFSQARRRDQSGY